MGWSITFTLAVIHQFCVFFAKSHPLDPERLEIAKPKFKHLEPAGIVRRSKSPMASPLHMVPKKDGSWRPCGDYCHLNLVTTPDKYSLPNIQDLSNGLHGCNIFSKINPVKGYHQITVAAIDIPKRPLSCHLACLSICSHHLGYLTQHRPFNE
jgi:hypothetical protein